MLPMIAVVPVFTTVMHAMDLMKENGLLFKYFHLLPAPTTRLYQ